MVAPASRPLFELPGHTAVFDETERYRYRLSRVWRPIGPRLLFIMLNPSTADVVQNDPTVRKCLGFARLLGYGALDVGNIFAWRSTDPHVLKGLPDPVGPDNDRHLVAMAQGAGLIVCAWGAHGSLNGRDRRVRRLLAPWGVHVLKFTPKGHPQHPLYLPYSCRPIPWVA